MAYRKDRNITREVANYRRMLAHALPSRDQSSVFFTQMIDVTDTVVWLDEYQQRTGQKMSMLMLFMTAAGRMLHDRLNLNVYVEGQKFYQRDGVTLTVSAKKEMRDGAHIVALKLPILKHDKPQDVAARFAEMLGEGRSGKEMAQEKEHRSFLMVPTFMMRWIMWLAYWGQSRRLLPSALVDPDPMYTSMFVANLGSVGLDSAYHHLYEWGTAGIFAVLGCIHDRVVARDGEPVVRKMMEVRYTFDERVSDGLATAFGLKGVKEYLEDPARFEAGMGDLGDLPPGAVSSS